MPDVGRLLTFTTLVAIGIGTVALTRWLLFHPNTTTTKSSAPATTPTAFVNTSVSNPGILQMLFEQEVDDSKNAIFRPNLTQFPNLSWPEGTLSLSEVVHKGHESVIYSVKESENLLVKFQANCDELESPLHPSIRDYRFGSIAYSAGVGPIMHFISPPVPLVYSKITRNFALPSARFQTCVTQGGTVRFIVLNRCTRMVDLYVLRRRFPLGMVPFKLAMTIAINLIQELRRLHLTAHVVHGDLHPGNILVDDMGNVKIIDYERSSRYTDRLDENPSPEKSGWYHEAFSHWQIQGYEWSMRDDVFNAMRAIAIMMNTDVYRVFESVLVRNPYQLMKWKRGGFIFNVPLHGWNVTDPILVSEPIASLEISESRKLDIRNSLGRVLNSVRSLVSVNEVPHYDSIIREFEHCRLLAR